MFLSRLANKLNVPSAEESLPGRDTAIYKEYQRSFQIGTAALEAGREDLARKHLDRAIELIPGEPAACARAGTGRFAGASRSALPVESANMRLGECGRAQTYRYSSLGE